MRLLFAVGIFFQAAGSLWALDCAKPENLNKCPKEFFNAHVPQPWHAAGWKYQQDHADIQIKIDEAIKAQEEAVKQRDLFDSSAANEDYDTALIAAKNMKAAQEDMYSLYNEAIRMTVATYHLEPGVLNAPNEYEGVGATHQSPWYPRFSEKEVCDPKTGFERPQNEADAVAEAAAAGLPAGKKLYLLGRAGKKTAQIRIYARTFKDAGNVAGPGTPSNPALIADPGRLAATIFHETVHWLDLVSRGRRLNPSETYRSEEKAYDMIANTASVFGYTAGEVKFQRSQSARFAKKAKAVAGKRWSQLPGGRPNWMRSSISEIADVKERPGEPGYLEPVKAGGEADFYESIKQIGEFSKEVKRRAGESIDREERERHERQDQKQKEFMRRWTAEEAARLKVWKYMRRAAGLACSNPRALLEQSDRVIAVGINPSHFASFTASAASGPGSLNRCQKFVLRRAQGKLWRNEPIWVTEMAQWGQTYRDAHPSLLKRFTTTLGEFFQALGEIGAHSGFQGGGSRKTRPREREQEREREPEEFPCSAPHPETGVIGCPAN